MLFRSMLESARKGYWKASDEQLKTTASLHAQITREKGAACTEFVCDNDKLQSFVADQLDNSEKQTYTQNMKEVHEASATDGKDVVLKEHKLTSEQTVRKNRVNGVVAGSLVVITFIGLVVLLKKRKKEEIETEYYGIRHSSVSPIHRPQFSIKGGVLSTLGNVDGCRRL